MQLRQIILDTETTGLEPSKGHKVIEIGCIEMINRRFTGNNFHVYINPERDIDSGAEKVHGISAVFLKDKPVFSTVYKQFKEYVDGAQLIIHNAPFDIGFLNHEFKLIDPKNTPLDRICSVIDTLAMARSLHPGQKNSLDALCKRYQVDSAHRSLHGALIDADLLARVYLAMTGGQTELFTDAQTTANNIATTAINNLLMQNQREFKVIQVNDIELTSHNERVEVLLEKSKTTSLWEETE